jgi:hypothetical protein
MTRKAKLARLLINASKWKQKLEEGDRPPFEPELQTIEYSLPWVFDSCSSY